MESSNPPKKATGLIFLIFFRVFKCIFKALRIIKIPSVNVYKRNKWLYNSNILFTEKRYCNSAYNSSNSPRDKQCAEKVFDLPFLTSYILIEDVPVVNISAACILALATAGVIEGIPKPNKNVVTLTHMPSLKRHLLTVAIAPPSMYIKIEESILDAVLTKKLPIVVSGNMVKIKCPNNIIASTDKE